MIFRSAYSLLCYYLTLFLFGVFGLGLCGLAVLLCWLPDTDRTQRFCQRVIHRLFAFFVWWIGRVCWFPVRYHQLDQLRPDRRGRVLVANHPALIDITCLLARLPEAVCVFKPAIQYNPVLGAVARRAGYLVGDGGHDMLRAAADKVAAGHTLVVFPEGTRTPPGTDLLPLKSGFVLIARRAGVPIQPVHIAYNRPIMPKGRALWKVPPLPATGDITFGPCLEVPPEAETAEIVTTIETWLRSPSLPAAHP